MLRIFNVKQGDAFTFTITFKNLQGNLSALDMGVKLDYKDDTLLITKGMGQGITKISTGKYRVDFSPAETKSLQPNFYVYDLRLKIGDLPFTPLYGYLNIQETVYE